MITFIAAVTALEEGKVLRRASWAHEVIFKQVPVSIDSSIVPNMQSLPPKAKEMILRSARHIDYRSQCIVYNTVTGTADSWSPSTADIFADDWCVVDI